MSVLLFILCCVLNISRSASGGLHCAYIDGLDRTPAPETVKPNKETEIMEVGEQDGFEKHKKDMAEIWSFKDNTPGKQELTFEEWRKFWEPCTTVWRSNYDSITNPWDDDEIAKHVAEVVMGPRGDPNIVNTVVMTFSMGNLVLASALQKGICKLSYSARWISLAGPWSGSGIAQYGTQVCQLPTAERCHVLPVHCGEALYALAPFSPQFMKKGEIIREIAKTQVYAYGCARQAEHDPPFLANAAKGGAIGLASGGVQGAVIGVVGGVAETVAKGEAVYADSDNCVEVTSCSSGWQKRYQDHNLKPDGDWQYNDPRDNHMFFVNEHGSFAYPSFDNRINSWIQEHAFRETHPPVETQCTFTKNAKFEHLGDRFVAVSAYRCARYCLENGNQIGKEECTGVTYWNDGGCHLFSSGEIQEDKNDYELVGSYKCTPVSSEKEKSAKSGEKKLAYFDEKEPESNPISRVSTAVNVHDNGYIIGFGALSIFSMLSLYRHYSAEKPAAQALLPTV